MLEDLANSRYLITAYATSSESWERFRANGDKARLFEVAAGLCGAWSLLKDDTEYFDALSELAAERSDVNSVVHRFGADRRVEDRELAKLVAEVEAHLDVDTLLAHELAVLYHAGMDPAASLRLVTDLRETLGDRVRPYSQNDLNRLKKDSAALAKHLCEAQQILRAFDYDLAVEVPAGHPPQRRWLRVLGTVGKGLRATAGFAGAAGNVAAAVGSFGTVTGLALASVYGGVDAAKIVLAEWGERKR